AYATIKVLARENPEARILLVVNMARSAAEADEVADRMTRIARQFVNKEIEYLGFIPHDPVVPHAVRTQQPFVLSAPHAPAARALQGLGHEVRVAMPCYKMIETDPKYDVTTVVAPFPIIERPGVLSKAYVKQTFLPAPDGETGAPIPVYLIGNSPDEHDPRER